MFNKAELNFLILSSKSSTLTVTTAAVFQAAAAPDFAEIHTRWILNAKIQNLFLLQFLMSLAFRDHKVHLWLETWKLLDLLCGRLLQTSWEDRSVWK